ncbi:MAG: hypothetical protein ABFE01_28880, partial [Phycisphaerales bacterium]
PYEWRIAAMELPNSWKAMTLRASPEGEGTCSIKLVELDGWRMRVRIDSATGGDIGWAITFGDDAAGK